ncbi:MAG: hypothetical protein E6I86_14020 [Chloroflexi bacterium]|nr:MAG: hypothetical protein E6I86_14020 [Chloroflexota bacterium]
MPGDLFRCAGDRKNGTQTLDRAAIAVGLIPKWKQREMLDEMRIARNRKALIDTADTKDQRRANWTGPFNKEDRHITNRRSADWRGEQHLAGLPV